MSNVLTIRNLSKTFLVEGRPLLALDSINLTVAEGEFVAIVGHSGCGKSTLLKIIAGLETADPGGAVTLRGREISEPGPDRGMIFQEHRLMPWLTVEKNVTLGLGDKTRREKALLADEYLKLVKLEGFKKTYPAQLSGGMSQRAAIARALATNPETLLLDEPFGALDALTKIEMQKEIMKIQSRKKTTMILVTHDIEEAVFLAHRIVVMSNRPGRIRDIVSIELPETRNRGNADFGWYKKRFMIISSCPTRKPPRNSPCNLLKIHQNSEIFRHISDDRKSGLPRKNLRQPSKATLVWKTM